MIDIENITPVPQPIYKPNGTKKVIAPFGCISCNEDDAKQFLNERAAYVRVYRENSVPPLLIGEEELWVANQCGSPFVPKKFQVTVIKNNAPEIVEMPNPVAVPMPIQHDMQTGQGKDPYGRNPKGVDIPADYNNLPYHIHIRAATRSRVSRNVANFLLTRDSMDGEYQKGKLIQSRPVSEFEPNESWSFEDVALYARIVDKDHFSDKDLSEIINEATEGRFSKIEDVNSDVEKECCHALYRRLCYRLHDPMWALPTKAGFEKVKEGDKMPEDLKRRGPGRPRASDSARV